MVYRPPWLVVPVLRSCQSPKWIWLVNYLHLHLHGRQCYAVCQTFTHTKSPRPCRKPYSSHTALPSRACSTPAVPAPSLPMPTTQATARHHQHRHCEPSVVVAHALLTPTPAVHPGSPRLHRSRQQIAQRTSAPRGMWQVSATMCPRRFTKRQGLELGWSTRGNGTG